MSLTASLLDCLFRVTDRELMTVEHTLMQVSYHTSSDFDLPERATDIEKVHNLIGDIRDNLKEIHHGITNHIKETDDKKPVQTYTHYPDTGTCRRSIIAKFCTDISAVYESFDGVKAMELWESHPSMSPRLVIFEVHKARTEGYTYWYSHKITNNFILDFNHFMKSTHGSVVRDYLLNDC